MKLFYSIIFLSAILHAAPGKLQAVAEGPRKLGDMMMGMTMSKSNQPLLLSLSQDHPHSSVIGAPTKVASPSPTTLPAVPPAALPTDTVIPAAPVGMVIHPAPIGMVIHPAPIGMVMVIHPAPIGIMNIPAQPV
jgi:hypothetical protein